MGVRVKKLEWSEERRPNSECSYNHVVAATPFGDASIEWKGWKEYDAFVVFFDGDHIASERTLELAKEAMQTAFDQRILSSIEQD